MIDLKYLHAVPYVLGIVWVALGSLAILFNISSLKSLLILISTLFPVVLWVVSRINTLRSFFWTLNTFTQWIRPVPFEALDYILTHAKQGDADSVVRAFDTFCWEKFMMNLGDVKGLIVDKALQASKPKVAVELGSHCGYSTIRFAAQLKQGAILHSVDPDPLGHAVSAKLIHFAGVSERVKTWYGYSGDCLKTMAHNGMVIDFLFLDHGSSHYLPDLQLVLSLNLLREGSVVLADNVLYPGAPEYKEWILKQSFFKTEVNSTFIEYSKTTRDEVLVSTYLGKDKMK